MFTSNLHLFHVCSISQRYNGVKITNTIKKTHTFIYSMSVKWFGRGVIKPLLHAENQLPRIKI